MLHDTSMLLRKALRRLVPEQSAAQEFTKSAHAFADFLKRCDLAQLPPASGKPVGIVVSAWFGTPVPWYSIALGIGLALRGRNILFLFEDTAPDDESGFISIQNEAIAQTLQIVAPRLSHCRLSHEPKGILADQDLRQIDHVAALTQIWTLRAASPKKEDRLKVAETTENLTNTLKHIRGLLDKTSLFYLVIPGGVIGTSGMFVHACQQARLPYSTYDANLGVVQISTNGIASQQSDVARAFDELVRSGVAEKTLMVTEAKTAFEERVHARDQAAYQLAQPAKSEQPLLCPDVVIPMNVEWDSAALGNHVVFQDTVEWLTTTIRFILENFPQCTVAVRQHPSERRVLERSQFDVAQLLEEHFGQNAQLHLVRAADEVNTYDLMATASVVLPFVSTIGIEAAAMGKTVIVSGSSYYSELGFVSAPHSRKEYLSLLEGALSGDPPLLPNQVEKAWLCYYLTPVCNRVWTQFTPQPVDFPRWSSQMPDDLFNDPAVSDILTAIDESIPLSLIRHKRKLNHRELTLPA